MGAEPGEGRGRVRGRAVAARLTAVAVRTLGAGRHGDGNGLYLLVRSNGWRGWIMRYKAAGKAREIGLGAASGPGAVGLAEARAKAGEHRRTLLAGADPLDKRQAVRAALVQQAASAMAFRTVADLYIAGHGGTWKSDKHRAQWPATLSTYAYPFFGDKPVSDVTTGDVMTALEPVWLTKPETASRLRGRIETVLDYARSREWRTAENPARWRGHLENILPSRTKVRAVKHHAALPWGETPMFMAQLRGREGLGAPALELAILTAARSGEVRGMTWGEIDLGAAVWTVPAARMKAHREHRVPLASAAVALLQALRPDMPDAGALVFPGAAAGHPLSDMTLTAVLRRMGRGDLTAHGFRSCFRDWAAESRMAYEPQVVEMALAHTVGSKVEAAYRRGDLFDKRRRLMDDWAAFCSRPSPSIGEVIPLRREVHP